MGRNWACCGSERGEGISEVENRRPLGSDFEMDVRRDWGKSMLPRKEEPGVGEEV